MKRVKKAIIAALAAGTALLCLAGCGSDFVGEWELSEYKKPSGKTVSAKDFKENNEYDISDFMKFEIDKDGTGTFTVNDGYEKETYDFDWEEDDGKIKFEFDKKVDGEKKLKGKIKDDELVVNIDDYSYYFTNVDED